MDEQALALAKAIRRAETGNSSKPYETKGASGETGAYQFMPDTWKQWSKQYLGAENAPLSVANQNKVAYSRIKELKDQGLSPAEIASTWNSGRADAYKQGKKGTNKYGVAYDVPAYVAKVSAYYKQLRPQTDQQPQEQKPFRYDVPEDRQQKIQRYQSEAQTAQAEADKYKGLGFAKQFGKELIGMVAPGPVGLGQTIQKTFLNQSTKYVQPIESLSKTQADLIKLIRKNESEGKDTTKLKRIYNDNANQLEELQRDQAKEAQVPTTKQAVGQLAQTGLDVLTAGTYGAAAKGSKAFQLGSKTAVPSAAKPILESTKFLSKPTAKAVATGAGIGYGYDVTQGLMDEEQNPYTPGFGTAVGTLLPLAGRAAVSKSRPQSAVIDELVSKAEKELTQLEDSYAGLRKFNEYSKDAKGSRDRIIRSDVLVDSVDESGTIRTKQPGGAIDQYRKVTLDEAEGVVRKDLEREGAKVSIETIDKKLNQVINDSKLPALEKELALKKVQKEIESLKKSADERGFIELTRLQDEKIANYAITDYLTPAEKNVYRKALGRAYKQIIEETSNLNIKETNDIIADYLKDIKRLELLDGKKVKGGRLGKYFAQLSGNITGGAVGSVFGPAGSATGTIIGGEVAQKIKSILMKNTFKETKAGIKQSPVLKESIERSKSPRPALPAQTTPFKKVMGSGKTIELPARSQSTIDQSNPLGNTKTTYNKPSNTTKSSISKVSPKKEKKKGGVVEKIKKALGSDLPNKQGGFVKIGRSQPKTVGPKSKVNESVSSTKSNTDYNVGLSAVKGKISQQLDDLADQAYKLFQEGKVEDAQKIYDKITQQAQKTIQNRFRGTGIDIKMKGTGFGVYQGTPEPNIDFIAKVADDQEDLFHQILTDISEKDFKQDSFLTYKPAGVDAKIGVVDAKKGIINEPDLSFTFEKPLTLAEIEKTNKALADAGLEAMSIKDGGKRIDLIHLTAYNGNDYEKWTKQAINFAENLKREGLTGIHEQGISKSRFIGSETSGANTTYQRNRGNFYKKNKEYINPDINSKVLDAIKYRKTISKGELQGIVNSGDISPTEKAVFKEVLDDLKDGKIRTKEIQGRLRGKLLTLEPKYANKYEAYGFDNLNIDRPAGSAKAVVFDSNLKHGRGKNHFEEEGLFGHARYFKDYDDNVYIGEVQSDVFQDNANVQYIKNFYENELEKLESKLAYANESKERYRRLIEDAQDRLGDPNKGYSEGTKESIKVSIYSDTYQLNKTESAIRQSEKQIALMKKYLASDNKDTLVDQFVNFSRKDKYRDRLWEETINNIVKDNPDAKKIRLATPSSVAKIEGYAGTSDDFAPYEVLDSRGNGRIGNGADDLEIGDTIDYGGETMVVVDVPTVGRGWGGPPPTNIVVAPEDKVTIIWESLNDVIEDGIQNRFSDDVRYELKEELAKGLTPQRAQEIIDEPNVNGGYSYGTEEFLQLVADQEGLADEVTYTEKNVDDLYDDWRNKVYESESEMYNQSELENMYGEGNVFFEDISRGRGYDYRVRIVEDGVETFDQPSGYSAMDNESIVNIDDDIELAKETFDSTQMGVLENYYKVQEEFIPKLEKELNVKIEKITDDEGNTWWEIPVKEIKKTAFGFLPFPLFMTELFKKKEAPLPKPTEEKKEEPVKEYDKYSKAIQTAQEKIEKEYGIKFPKGFGEAIFEQESSRKFTPTNMRLAVGFTDIAEKELGDKKKPNTSPENVFENMYRLLAMKATHTNKDGSKKDMTKDPVKWYIQKYVGIYPGESRNINGEDISYEKLYNMFKDRLNKYQQ